MSIKSKIEWTDTTWNPIRGCTKISDGCKNCYAEKMASRFSQEGQPFFQVINHDKHWSNKIQLLPESLSKPLSWKKPSRIFVNSMSDLFHEDVPVDFIQEVFSVMRQTFQVLTKRADRLLKIDSDILWSDNIWMGVTVENTKCKSRIDILKKTNAKIKFLSIEPLLEDLGDVDMKGIHWVIVGGESGKNARKMEKQWVDNIFNRCKDEKVPFFFKQWGGILKKKNGRIFNGGIWSEMPHVSDKLSDTLSDS